MLVHFRCSNQYDIFSLSFIIFFLSLNNWFLLEYIGLFYIQISALQGPFFGRFHYPYHLYRFNKWIHEVVGIRGFRVPFTFFLFDIFYNTIVIRALPNLSLTFLFQKKQKLGSVIADWQFGCFLFQVLKKGFRKKLVYAHLLSVLL